jgi:hypothetical protein
MATLTVTLFDDEGNEEVIEIPCVWEICDDCRGEGRHSAHLGVIDRSDWGDDEFEDYLRGAYDRACGCDGGRVKVPNLDRLDAATRARVEEHWDDEAHIDAIAESERRMGA